MNADGQKESQSKGEILIDEIACYPEDIPKVEDGDRILLVSDFEERPQSAFRSYAYVNGVSNTTFFVPEAAHEKNYGIRYVYETVHT